MATKMTKFGEEVMNGEVRWDVAKYAVLSLLTAGERGFGEFVRCRCKLGTVEWGTVQIGVR